MIELEKKERISEHSAEDRFEDDPVESKPQGFWESFQERFSKVWSGWQGMSIMGLGVVLPAVITTIYGIARFEALYHIALKQPVEMLIEIVLILLVPFANYRAWSVLKDEKPRHRPGVWIASGASICTSALLVCVSIAAIVAGLPALGYATGLLTTTLSLIAGTAACALVCACIMARQLCLTWQTAGARASTAIFILVGMLVSAAGLVGAETRSTIIRHAEYQAVSGDMDKRSEGLSILRSMNAERDLRLTCSDARAAGIPGLFFNIDTATERQLYFTVTGKPYRNNLTADLSAMPDEDLMRHAVGPKLDGLSMVRSSVSGSLHPDTLSSTVHWTFVFKNDKYHTQAARAQFQLPPDAVLSGITMWEDGNPKQGAVGATGRLAGRTNTFYTDGYDPMLVKDLGKGRILLTCHQVPARSELKIRVAITAPMQLQSTNEALLKLPRFTATNFNIKNGHHVVRMRSTDQMSMGLKKQRKRTVPGGDRLTVGELKPDQLFSSGVTVVAQRRAEAGTVTVLDPFSKNGNFIVQTVKATSTHKPEHLVVVLDGSVSMKKHLKGIKAALEKIPAHINASLIFAGDNQSTELVPLAGGLKNLTEKSFKGGRDNLESVIKAAETAGETDGGAVLWIHGPQSNYNREIYIMAPYIATPLFYECAVDNSWSDASDFLKNHREIGPFMPVTKTDSITADLRRFVSAWQEGSKTYSTDLVRTNYSNGRHLDSGIIPYELARLAAFRESQKLMAQGQEGKAALLAIRYKLVTPFTTSVVLNNDSDYSRFGGQQPTPTESSFDDMLHTQYDRNQANELQGATNGTIGPDYSGAYNGTVISPQSGDATIIQGVNTAGTVRVNNLANLEAFLNILANLGEITGFVLGLVQIIAGLMQKPMLTPFRLSPGHRIAFGVMLGLIGLMVPGSINWLVASARDANLFA